MTVLTHFKRCDKTGIDYQYITTDTSTFRFTLPLYHKRIPKEFINKWVSITPGIANTSLVVKVFKGYAFDGCSCVPDIAGTVDAALLHDPIYQFADAIAEAWGWRVRDVLRMADYYFRLVMIYNNVSDKIVWTYYTGVRLFGYTYNRVSKFLRWIF